MLAFANEFLVCFSTHFAQKLIHILVAIIRLIEIVFMWG